MPPKKIPKKRKDHLNLTHEKRRFTKKEFEQYIKRFRVAIFGSARIKSSDKIYKEVFNLSKEIGAHKFDIVTGGGPGIMEAANAGHEAGDPKDISDSIGLAIKLPWETKKNKHLDIKKHYHRFTTRLDKFMALSNVVIVMPGGIGTCLELFYTLQLIQVRHINLIPIILYGKMWEELLKWIKKWPLKQGLVSPGDLKAIHVARNRKEAMKIIMQNHAAFNHLGDKYPSNYDKYPVKF